MKAKVAILYTGGTIGMAPEDPSKAGSPLVPKPLDELLKFVPGLGNGQIELSFQSFDAPLDSSNVGPDDWVRMAQWLESVYEKHDGFVILHGTDTMAFTSSALSFMCENLAKPVVITGSQLPISDIRTDAVMNLVNAVYVAGYKVQQLPRIPEVVIVFADKIVRGCRASKVSASSWAGFDSPNYPNLGHIGEHIRIDPSLLRPMPGEGENFQINTELNTKVLDIALRPQLRAETLRRMLLNSDEEVDGIILGTYGAGNAPSRPDFLQVFSDVSAAGKTILNVTQCIQGMVEMGLYAASSGLLDRGVISALDMTAEAAVTKFMWTLGTKMGGQVAAQMQVSQRGEQSQNLFDLRYGGFGNPGAPAEATVFKGFVTPDRRLDVRQISRAVVRFSEIGFDDVEKGHSVTIRVFVNQPSATSDTPADHPKCVANIDLVWQGEKTNIAAELDYIQTRTVVGQGDISISVVCSDPKVRFWFKGLFLAVFAKA